LIPAVTDPAVEVYEITSELGLEGCLDDFEAYLKIR
jgi:hypothetical protein